MNINAIKARLAAVHAAGVSVVHTQLINHGIRVLVSMRDWSGNNRYDADEAVTTLLGNAPADIAALVEEVERLRELLLNAGWPREAEGLAVLALQYERAAVVAYLRAPGTCSSTDVLAEDIERGAHRREEGA
tara:strand:+ start:187 stop:582 length:396 start_codon:yes stop_codon:yes gene_type:complete